MSKYVKKPIVIEAFKLGFEEAPSWFVDSDDCITVWGFVDGCDTIEPVTAKIMTLEGAMEAYHGDYIIKGIKGEIYPCKADIFHATFQAITDHYVATVGAGFTVDEKIWSQPGDIIPTQD